TTSFTLAPPDIPCSGAPSATWHVYPDPLHGETKGHPSTREGSDEPRIARAGPGIRSEGRSLGRADRRPYAGSPPDRGRDRRVACVVRPPGRRHHRAGAAAHPRALARRWGPPRLDRESLFREPSNTDVGHGDRDRVRPRIDRGDRRGRGARRDRARDWEALATD